MDDEVKQHSYEHLLSLDLRQLAFRYLDLRDKKDLLEAQLAEVNKEFDWVRITRIPEVMADADTKTVTYEGIGRVTLTADAYASIVRDKKEAAYQWLEDTGRGDIILPYVQPSTLKATLVRMMKKGEEIPEELFTVTPFMRATVSKT